MFHYEEIFVSNLTVLSTIIATALSIFICVSTPRVFQHSPSSIETTSQPTSSLKERYNNNFLYMAASFLSFIVPLFLYIKSTPTSVYLVDSGSFTLAAFTPGVAHPPGFPAFVLLGWLFLKLPFQLYSVAHRLNLLSGILGALTVHLVYRIGRKWCLKTLLAYDGNITLHPLFVEAPPLIGATLCMFMWPIWMYSTITEVYTLTSSSLLLSIFTLIKWQEIHNYSQGNHHHLLSRVYLFIAGVFFGVAGSSHHVTAALALPALCYMVYSHKPTQALGNILTCAFAALVTGIFFYGFLFYVALSNPLWSWGGANTFRKLVRHAIGKQYSVNLLGSNLNWESTQMELWRITWITIFSYTPMAIFVILRSFSDILWRAPPPTYSKSEKKVYAHTGTSPIIPEKRMLACLTSFGIFFCFLYTIAEDKEGYFMTTSWSVALAYCIGTFEILAAMFSVKGEAITSSGDSSSILKHDESTKHHSNSNISKKNHKAKEPTRKSNLHVNKEHVATNKKTNFSFYFKLLAIFTLAGSPFIPAFHNKTQGGCYRPHDNRASTIVNEVVSNLPQGSLLFTKEFQFYSPWIALHHIEGLRPDLVVVDLLLAKMSWYLDYLRKHAPVLMKKVRKEEMAYRKLLRLFEEDEPYNGDEIQASYVAFLNALLRANKNANNNIFYMPQLGQRDEGVGTDFIWVPWGLVTKGIDQNENLSPSLVRDACSVLKRIPSDYPWIRHAFDIEGWKLGMLYYQGLVEQARIWQSLSQLNNPSLREDEIVTKEESQLVFFDAGSSEHYLKTNAPYNVKSFYKARQ